jgi:hypothetical protein
MLAATLLLAASLGLGSAETTTLFGGGGGMLASSIDSVSHSHPGDNPI